MKDEIDTRRDEDDENDDAGRTGGINGREQAHAGDDVEKVEAVEQDSTVLLYK